MSDSRSQHIVEVAALDADGTLYNKIYYATLYVLAHHYGERFIALAEKRKASPGADLGPEFNDEVNRFSEQMRGMLNLVPWLSETSLAQELFLKTINNEQVAQPVMRFNQALRFLAPAVYQLLIEKTNEALFADFAEKMKLADSGYVAIASARQTKWHNDEGMKKFGSGSVFDDWEDVAAILSRRTGKNIQYFRGTLGDAYRGKTAGTSVDEISSESEDTFGHLVGEDGEKISLHYYLMHAIQNQVVQENPSVTVRMNYRFVDDVGGILEAGYRFYKYFPYTSPAGCHMHWGLFCDGLKWMSVQPIAGEGVVDTDLARTFGVISEVFGLKSEEDNSLMIWMDQAKAPLFFSKRAGIDLVECQRQVDEAAERERLAAEAAERERETERQAAEAAERRSQADAAVQGLIAERDRCKRQRSAVGPRGNVTFRLLAPGESFTVFNAASTQTLVADRRGRFKPVNAPEREGGVKRKR